MAVAGLLLLKDGVWRLQVAMDCCYFGWKYGDSRLRWTVATSGAMRFGPCIMAPMGPPGPPLGPPGATRARPEASAQGLHGPRVPKVWPPAGAHGEPMGLMGPVGDPALALRFQGAWARSWPGPKALGVLP